MSASLPYDRLAPHYRAIAQARSTYLDAVDRYVIAHARRGGSMLDVGSGDGVRAVRIARAIDAAALVLCEPSEGMLALCREQQADEIWQAPAQCLPATTRRFDVITCLWNVMGHLPGSAARVEALRAMRGLLAPGGRIFCDVNNRHNARAYGSTRVMLRRLIDRIFPDEARGDASFEWNVGAERIPASGHLFTPREARALAAAAGLRVSDELSIDYAKGASSPRPWDGQLVYRLQSNESDGQEVR